MSEHIIGKDKNAEQPEEPKANVAQAGDNQDQEKDIEFVLKITWKEHGIRIEGNCVKNEMTALYLLHKAEQFIVRVNQPNIIKSGGTLANIGQKIKGAFGGRRRR